MTAVINGIVVNGSTEEIKKLIDIYNKEKEHKINEVEKINQRFEKILYLLDNPPWKKW